MPSVQPMTVPLPETPFFQRMDPDADVYARLPRFRPSKKLVVEGETCFVGPKPPTVNIPFDRGVTDGWLGLMGCEPVPGRWLAVDSEWAFFPQEDFELEWNEGADLLAYHGHWGDSARIVLGAQKWTASRFQGAAWDHSGHCGVCWRSICLECPEFFQNELGDLVCPHCHNRYVKRRCLSFIPLDV